MFECSMCTTMDCRPGLSQSTENFSQDALLDAELATIGRFLALAANPDETGVRCLPGLKVRRVDIIPHPCTHHQSTPMHPPPIYTQSHVKM